MICGKLHTLKMQNNISLIFISIKLLIIIQNRWFTVPWVLVPFLLFLFTCKSYICFSMLSLTVQSRVTIRCGFVTDWTFLVVVHMYRHSYYYLTVIVNDCRSRWGICFCAFIYIHVYCADFTSMFFVIIFFCLMFSVIKVLGKRKYLC